MKKKDEVIVVGVAWTFAPGFSPTVKLARELFGSPNSVLNISHRTKDSSGDVELLRCPMEKVPLFPSIGAKGGYLLFFRGYPITELRVEGPAWAVLKWKYVD